jgi:hypothetical protein
LTWGPVKPTKTIEWKAYQFGFVGTPALSFGIRTNNYPAYNIFPGFDISTSGGMNPDRHDEVAVWSGGSGQSMIGQVQVRWSPSAGASFTSTNFANNANYTNVSVPNIENDATARTRFVFAFASATDNFNWHEFSIDNVKIESDPEDCVAAFGASSSCCDVTTTTTTATSTSTTSSTVSSTASTATEKASTTAATVPVTAKMEKATTPTAATTTTSSPCSTFTSCESCVTNATSCFWCMAVSKCVQSALNCDVALRKCPLPTTANNLTMALVTAAAALPPPAWLFGAAGGGFVALLLLVGAVSLGCWCNKRGSNVATDGDAQMVSFRDPEANSSKICFFPLYIFHVCLANQRASQYATFQSTTVSMQFK